MLEAITSIYTNSAFYTYIDGTESAVRTQRAGIRQRCPLSPYLFIIVMSLIFEDIKETREGEEVSQNK